MYCVAGLTDLPQEILAYIFEHLPLDDCLRVRLVSRVLRQAAEQPRVWRNVNLNKVWLVCENFDYIMSHAPFMRELKFGGDVRSLRNDAYQRGEVDTYISDNLSRCTGIVKLVLTRNYILQDCNFLANMPYLVELEISECHNIAVSSLTTHLPKCKKLTYLDLYGMGQLTEIDIFEIGIQLPALQWINVQNSAVISPKTAEEMLQHLPLLRFFQCSPDRTISNRQKWAMIVSKFHINFCHDIMELFPNRGLGLQVDDTEEVQ